MLLRYSLAEINSMRTGIVAGSAGQGDPYAYALFEDETQVTKLRFGSVPGRVCSFDIERSALPATAYTDATVLPFVDSFLRVVEKATALELAAKQTQETLQRLGLNPSVFPLWQKDVTEGITAEKLRMARTLRRPYGVGAVV